MERAERKPFEAINPKPEKLFYSWRGEILTEAEAEDFKKLFGHYPKIDARSYIRPIEQVDSPSAPEFLVQAIVENYGDVPDGSLVRVVEPTWRMLVDRLTKDWNEAFKIPWRTWEEIIAAAFSREGFEVTLTPSSRDHGIDVIAEKRSVIPIRIITSVKAYKPGHLVRHDHVRALAGVLSQDSASSKGIITTTSDFASGVHTDPFLARLMPTRLQLMNGSALREWFTKIR